MAHNIAQSIKNTKATDLEPELFSGNTPEPNDCECNFDSFMSSMGIEDGAKKIKYLKKYVAGAAKQCIHGLFLIRTNDRYCQTRKMRRLRFEKRLMCKIYEKYTGYVAQNLV